ncbi:hypothetical protein MMUR_66450 [Mycolicibacterium murale]|uniref:DUF7847 domain-containing protein n=1 Tax=Mycolicibacterium murale TaxID=182220 RepID=A0A7I9WXY8_9MYCO|nr:hypothetical protein [Mycolicibacterium murale]GFG62509.1 hypothetical protein MMUR_66450 [Mycolicibacterium murale]
MAGLVGLAATSVVAALMQALAAVILSGMLTVVVGRAVFGSSITISEAWAKIKDRILPLLGLALLELLAVLLLFGVLTLIIVGLAVGVSGAVAAVVGIPLGIAAVLGTLYLYTMVSFAPVAIVLERMPVIDAVKRSFALVRHDFLRVFGIRLLAGVVVAPSPPPSRCRSRSRSCWWAPRPRPRSCSARLRPASAPSSAR